VSDEARGAITVAGDLTIDWIFVAPPDASLQLAYQWDRKDSLTIAPLPGGAALIASILEGMGAPVNGPEVPAEALTDPRFRGITQTYSSWSNMPLRRGSSEGRLRFREFLGRAPASIQLRLAEVQPSPVLVIDDANLGFRGAPEAWMKALTGSGTVILKMTPPLANGPLWEQLAGSNRGGLVIYVSLGDLRMADAAVGQALSWERSAIEIVAAVRARADLSLASRVIVGIGLSGAVVVERDGPATLVYDPEHLEGDWEAQHPGVPYATGSVIVAAVAAACQASAEPDVPAAISSGLALARRRHEEGLATFADGNVTFGAGSSRDTQSSAFAIAPVSTAGDWSFLRAQGELQAIAREVLFKGIAEAAPAIPIERMGAWVSVDRAEIESTRSVRNIIGEYVGQPIRTRPLSIAVFGPPGSGKSFAVKQMAGQWAQNGARLQVLEFNVSQFADAAALSAAFQRIRDCAVDGALPLVFWDEFDSVRDGRELGWLAQFLAPMQDGSFLEGSLVRPIGGALFVFAGGTHATMESFKSRASALPGAKATDFLSRLRGFVDVLGPNRSSAADDSFTVRRALLLRQTMLRRAPQLNGPAGLNVDPGVANAFLSVERYVHGARSMESIVEMSALAGRSRFARASLPAAHQLSLHVDSDEFLRLLDAK